MSTDTFTGRWQGMVNLATVIGNVALAKQQEQLERKVALARMCSAISQIDAARPTQQTWGTW